MGTLHCKLENGADLYVNERQKIRLYRARSTEERRRKIRKKKNAQSRFFFNLVGCLRKLCYYSDVIYSFDSKYMVEHDSGIYKT